MQTKREMQNGCPNQASGYETANKPKIIKKKNTWWKKRGKERKTNPKHFLKRKRRQEMSASNKTKAGYT